MSDAWVLAREALADAQKKYKFYHDKKISDPGSKVGDCVYLDIPKSHTAKHAKILRHDEGPILITAMPSPHNAMLKKLDGEGRVIGQGFSVHLARCKTAPVPPRLRNLDLGPGLGTDKNKLKPVPRYNLRQRKVKK